MNIHASEGFEPVIAGVDRAATEIGIQVDHLPIKGSKLSTAGIPKTSKQFQHIELHEDRQTDRRPYISSQCSS